MSSLLLVRHAQASFLQSDYDVLSELGHAQSAGLGRRWAELGWQLDAVFVGPRRRQSHTAELVGDALEACGVQFPEPVVIDALDEYRAEALLERELLRLASADARLATLVAELQASTEARARARAFERVFQAVMRAWQRGEVRAEGVEAWAAFTERVCHTLRVLTAADRGGRRIAAFTSGGVIGVMVAEVLGAPPATALELGWTLHNASVTELLFSASRVGLSRYNDVAHLAEPSAWTYR